ncbi:MAG: CapA family protein [Acidobacteria bacterium]|nr:CapA family protein [Acidobacteriota bacterium]
MASIPRRYGLPVFALCSVVMVGAAGLIARQVASVAPDGPTWSLAATGDAIITRRVSLYDDPPFLDLVKVIREADAAFTNLEMSFFNLADFKGYPQVEQGGNWFFAPPGPLEDLKWMGFDLFNQANNHTTDWGVEGMLETSRLLDSLGLTHAGTGMTLGEATHAGYLDAKKGRFALIGLATTFTPMSMAGDPRPEVKGRPGLSGLRVQRTYQLEAARLADLSRVLAALRRPVPDSATESVQFLGATFVGGPESKVIEKTNPRDEERILRAVRSAAKQADYVVVTSHTHEPGNSGTEPPQFLIDFARKCIDAGADTYIGHGPHQLRGIEIYKGKPILYSLGNFFFQNETIEPMPSDMYENFARDSETLAGDLYDLRFSRGRSGHWHMSPESTIGVSPGPYSMSPVWYETVATVAQFRGHGLVELKLYPVEMGHKSPRGQKGTPRLANAQKGKEIIDRLTRLSVPFGTQIVFENGIGVWRPSKAGATAQQ